MITLLSGVIVARKFLGSSVERKDVIIIDDMISSGDSIINVATELKRRKAKRIYAAATVGLFNRISFHSAQTSGSHPAFWNFFP